jgi:hypothetical protein
MITLRIVKGAPLTIAELDGNFTDLDGRLITVEDGQAAVRSIEEIVQVGNSIVIQYTDSSQDGPFTFEVGINYRGDWEPLTSYAANDMVKANGIIYIVRIAHISGAEFDPGASAGSDGDYYQAFLEMPELVIPGGGDTGFVLTKVSGSDYDYQWVNAGVPAGGTAGQMLVKFSGDDYDTEWIDPDELTGAPEVATIASDTLTLNLTLNNFYLRCTNASGCVIIIPDNASVPFGVGTEIHFRQCSTGPLTFLTDGTGAEADINGVEGFDFGTNVQGAVVTIKKVAADEWDLFGLLAAENSA